MGSKRSGRRLPRALGQEHAPCGFPLCAACSRGTGLWEDRNKFCGAKSEDLPPCPRRTPTAPGLLLAVAKLTPLPSPTPMQGRVSVSWDPGDHYKLSLIRNTCVSPGRCPGRGSSSPQVVLIPGKSGKSRPLPRPRWCAAAQWTPVQGVAPGFPSTPPQAPSGSARPTAGIPRAL